MNISTTRLPAPLSSESFRVLKSGVYDDKKTSVLVNEANDFAFLDPLPKVNYEKYVSRVEQLGLLDYKKESIILNRRLEKIEDLIESASSFLEIGAADASFLKLLKENYSDIEYYAIEPDENTMDQRNNLGWLRHYSELDDAIEKGIKADIVAMFHVFEHIETPKNFLAKVKELVSGDGIILIEVPCMRDPLLSLYSLDRYNDFYFQCQHPYIYTASSLTRVLEHEGLEVDQVIYYQRYGLENHLQWMTKNKPGGNEEYRRIFSDTDNQYSPALEKNKSTDTIFVTARCK